MDPAGLRAEPATRVPQATDKKTEHGWFVVCTKANGIVVEKLYKHYLQIIIISVLMFRSDVAVLFNSKYSVILFLLLFLFGFFFFVSNVPHHLRRDQMLLLLYSSFFYV